MVREGMKSKITPSAAVVDVATVGAAAAHATAPPQGDYDYWHGWQKEQVAQSLHDMPQILKFFVSNIVFSNKLHLAPSPWYGCWLRGTLGPPEAPRASKCASPYGLGRDTDARHLASPLWDERVILRGIIIVVLQLRVVKLVG